MKPKAKLTKQITEAAFDNGYWYANEIKAFAKEIGIAHSSKLRKDELEKLIKIFLRTGKVPSATRKNIIKEGIKDLDKGLDKSLPVVNYSSNKQTKGFVISEALKRVSDLKVKPGVWYRLNRWRDEQMTNELQITYGDLIQQFIKLNENEDKFEKAAVGRYINFVAEYLANEQNATRAQAISEWKKLKLLDIPKDYTSWKKYSRRV